MRRGPRGSLHRLLTEAMVSHMPDQARLLELLLIKKFRTQGLRISAKRRLFIETIVRAVANGQPINGIALTAKRAIDLEFTSADIDAFSDQLQQALEKAAEATIRKTSKVISQTIVARARATAIEQRGAIARQTQRWMRPWAAALDWCRAVVGFCQDAAFLTAELPPARSDDRHVRLALSSLHAHGCLISGEVLTLLESGYAAGALARWRALHEVAVVADFIAAKGTGVARRFLEHEAANEKRMRSIAIRALSDGEELRPMSRRHERILTRQTSEFESDYGWAAQDLGKRSPTLTDLQTPETREHWAYPYALACGAVHPRAASVAKPLGHTGESGLLLIGASSADVHIAADWTIARLVALTATCTLRGGSVDEVVALVALHNVGKRARREIESGWRRWLASNPGVHS